MSWSYRILDFGTHKALHEVFYHDGEDIPHSWTEKPISFVCDPDESGENIIAALEMAARDSELPIVKIRDGKPMCSKDS